MCFPSLPSTIPFSHHLCIYYLLCGPRGRQQSVNMLEAKRRGFFSIYNSCCELPFYCHFQQVFLFRFHLRPANSDYYRDGKQKYFFSWKLLMNIRCLSNSPDSQWKYILQTSLEAYTAFFCLPFGSYHSQDLDLTSGILHLTHSRFTLSKAKATFSADIHCVLGICKL